MDYFKPTETAEDDGLRSGGQQARDARHEQRRSRDAQHGGAHDAGDARAVPTAASSDDKP